MLGLGVSLGLTTSPGCGQVTLPGDDIDAGSGAPDAGSGASDAMQPVDPRRGSSFEILAELTYTQTFPLPPEFLPDQHAFVLLLEEDGATTGAIAGVAGEAVTASFTRQASGELLLGGEIALSAAEGMSFLCGSDQMVYETMTLQMLDNDGDGTPDGVQGTATGKALGFGNFLGSSTFTAVLTGKLDVTPPELALVGSSADRSVLGDLVVQASEPLRPDLSVTAVTSSGVRVSLEPRPADGSSIVAFVSPEDVLMPFGEIIRLEVEPAIEDLAGNGGTLDTPTFQTIADPQDFPEDGFESEANVTLSGGAELVTGVGNARAIAGTTSLLLEPGGNATVRIPLQDAPAGSLVLQLRGLFPDETDRVLGGEIVLASPDAPAHARMPFPAATGETVATGDADWAFASNVTTMSVPLPAGAAGELVVVLRMPARSSCGDDEAPSANAAALIDGVRVLDGIAQPASAPTGD